MDRKDPPPHAGDPPPGDDDPAAADDVAERAAARPEGRAGRRLLRARLIRLGLVAGLIGAAVIAWRLSPASEIADVDAALDWAQSWRDSPLAPVYLIAAFVIGGILVMPVTLLVAVSGILFGAALGFPIAMTGALASALVLYYLGDWLGGDLIRRLAGDRVGAVSRALGRRGILTVALVRNIPIAPFSLVNLVAGATHIRLRDYLIGTFIGLAPGFLAITLFGTTIESTLRDPSPARIALLVLGAAAVVLAGWGTHWMIVRLRRRTR